MKQAHYIAIGDIHDNVDCITRIPELATAKGLIITGDITLWGGVQKAQKVIAPLAATTPLLFAQVGNMDKPEVTNWLEENGWNIHTKAILLEQGVILLGVGCSPETPFATPSEYPEQQFTQWLKKMHTDAMLLQQEITQQNQTPQVLLVSHTPPYETACDKLTNGVSVGSKAIRTFIEETKPDICICGHIHEAKGEDWIGTTHIVNPGPIANKGYVLITIQYTPQPIATAQVKTIAE